MNLLVLAIFISLLILLDDETIKLRDKWTSSKEEKFNENVTPLNPKYETQNVHK